MVEWSGGADWDKSPFEFGVVHENTANTDYTDSGTVRAGYSTANMPFADSLAFRWPLHEDSGTTAYDVVGGNNGTISGATVGQPGLLGTTCYSFDKANDLVVSDSSIPAISVGTDFTVSIWLNPDDMGTKQQIALQQVSGTDRFAMSINTRGNNHLEAGVYNGSHVGVSSGPASATQGWIHTVYTYASANTAGQLYFDTEPQSGPDAPNYTGTYDGPFYIGYSNNYNNPFGGHMGEIMVFNRQLSSSEVQELYDVMASTSSLTAAKQSL